jgi:hypothetical protein
MVPQYFGRSILAAVFWPLYFGHCHLPAFICPQSFARSQMTRSHLTAYIIYIIY